MLNFINPIKVIVLFSFVFALLRLNWRNKNHLYLILILAVCLITECVNSVLSLLDLSNGLAISISIIFHDCFWILLLRRNLSYQLTATAGLGLFLLFAAGQLILMESAFAFRYYSYTIGAFIYIVLFLNENFHQLKKENLSFFFSNTYLLLFAPVLFFIDLSLLFGFENRSLTSTKIFHGIKFYDFVIYFVNVVYYSLINVYIYREKKMKTWAIS
ncbi:hypothetical protein [Flavobacterium sp.]|uniref:hypothetical protein n=1 Tax=Flavobacterium sp. TaxID=239 RepID=UPI0039E6C07A